MRYLGVPIISMRLLKSDYKTLMEKVKNRIGNWKNKPFSIAGLLQLVTSILFSMHDYWASVLILPDSINLDIEKLMRGFL